VKRPIAFVFTLALSAALAGPAAAQACTDHLFPVALSAGAAADQQLFGRHCVPASSPDLATAGTLLVLVHGITYHRDYWDFADPTGGTDRYSFVAAAHAAGFSTLSIDRLGIRDSSHPLSADVNIDTNAHTVHEMLQAVRGGAVVAADGRPYAKIVQIGHSYGSWTTWFSATRHPGDVDAVVLTGATHGLTTVDAPFGVASRLYPASLDPRFGPLSGLDPGYLTTRPGERYGAFYSPAMVDPAVIEHDEATKETVTNAEIQTYQLILAEPLDIRVPVFLTIGQSDELFCGPAPGGADCSSEQALVDFERPFLGPNVPSVDAYVLVGGSHDMNQQLHAHLYFDAVIRWLNGTVLVSVGCAGDADCDGVASYAMNGR